MEQAEDKHLIFSIIEHGMKHQFFTLKELYENLQVTGLTVHYIRNTLVSYQYTSDNLNHIMIVVDKEYSKSVTPRLNAEIIDIEKLTLLPNAIVQYVDYLEIIEARKAATNANRQSTMALTVSVYALILTVIIGLAQTIFQVVELIIKK